MHPFEYVRPADLDSAATVFGAADDARLLAGGMTLVPALKLRLSAPSMLLDLGGLPELRGIRGEAQGLTIGAMTTHAEVAASADVQRLIPALADLAGGIGDVQVRHRGTLGGSVANADPSACYPAALLALGATVVSTRRRIAAEAFFTGMFSTALLAGEIVTAVHFPTPAAAAYEKFRSPASRYALVGVFIARTTAGVRVAVTGAAPCVFRAAAIEASLNEQFSPEAVAGLRFPPEGLNADLHGDAAYRAQLIGVLTRRAVARLCS
ncbi:FAD binding domain-containing protein [Aquabacterium sp.]|uniref:FAD binding domain-containing protein n=1 Tax=Aquabacterium sp. TaxID=1872578 RepID=UPI002B71ECFD|nr:xanthine dehydrogenase family protein subunit M [Aquabacterium sp.]HSW05303.1 xanthine dehydrogenase family protein subunit M [Aquabacterium sp.]